MAITVVRCAALASLVYLGSLASAAAFGPNGFMGSIGLIGTKYCPRESVEANGQLSKIADFNTLFALFGTTFGGDGTTTFGVPDLSAQVPAKGTRYCVVTEGIYPIKP